MTFSYDKAADVLYVTFERLPSQSVIYVENENGDVLRLDRETRRVVGVTIPFFVKRAAQQKVNVPEVSWVPFNDLATELVSS
jgi:uncharacterized protein YuzE